MRAAFPTDDVNTARCVSPEGCMTSRDKTFMICQKYNRPTHQKPIIYSVTRDLRITLPIHGLTLAA